MSLFHTARHYLKHYLTANTLHGTHSPFIYTLLENVIYHTEKYPAYKEIELLRNEFLSDNREILITDLGAGSRVNKAPKRRISDIARNSLKSPKYAQVLYRLVSYVKPEIFIELGTSLGITSLYLAEANPQGLLYTIEGCPETASVARELFKKTGKQNIIQETGNFDTLLPEVLRKTGKVDWLYIDGNHRKQATLEYFETSLPFAHEKSVFVFDDIYWSEGMTEAWNEIKARPEVTVTVDLFRIGLVFFHKSQAKEAFKIRF